MSRQLVAAVEAGHNAPAVDAAIRIARVLSVSVEELFADTPPDVLAALGGRLRDGALLRVGRVADQLVGVDHSTGGPSWAKPDGVLDAGELRLFPGAHPAEVVLAGCRPAIEIAEALLDELGPPRLLGVLAPTALALRALQRGRVHAAVLHVFPNERLESSLPVERWHVTPLRVGLAVPPGLRGQSLEAVLSSAVPLVQLDVEDASQQALERAQVAAGIAPRAARAHAAGHMDAARIAATLDAAAVTTEAAAQAFHLPFIALEDHALELWVSYSWRDHPGVNAVVQVLATTTFTERLGRFGRYDLSRCGENLGVSRPRATRTTPGSGSPTS